MIESHGAKLTFRRSDRYPLPAVSAATILLARRGPVFRRRVTGVRAPATCRGLASALTLVMVIPPSVLALTWTARVLERPEYLWEWRFSKFPY